MQTSNPCEFWQHLDMLLMTSDLSSQDAAAGGSPVVRRTRLRSREAADSDGSCGLGGLAAAGGPAAEAEASSPGTPSAPHARPDGFGSLVVQRHGQQLSLQSGAASSPRNPSPGKSPAKGAAGVRPALGELHRCLGRCCAIPVVQLAGLACRATFLPAANPQWVPDHCSVVWRCRRGGTQQAGGGVGRRCPHGGRRLSRMALGATHGQQERQARVVLMLLKLRAAMATSAEGRVHLWRLCDMAERL